MSPHDDAGSRPSDPDSTPGPEPVFRPPTVDDGLRMWEIARDTGVLDLNTEYAYALWGAEFADSSIVVEDDGRIVGFVTGFIRPSEPDSLFVWQVGVDADQRGKGYAKRMLHALMNRLADHGVVRLRTTVTATNEASQRTFAALARERDLDLGVEEYMSGEHLGEGFVDENLYTVGSEPEQTTGE